MRVSKYMILGLALVGALSACSPATQSPLQNAEKTPVHADTPTVTKTGDTYSVSAPISSFSDFYLIETQMGKQAPRLVDFDAVIKDLAQYDVIFVGESHGHAANHYVQSKLFSGLQSEHEDMALSMEQFERPEQQVVDDYLAGKIGEETLIHDGKAWEHYRSSYRPLVEFAKHKGLPIIAAEAPRNMVSCIGEDGPAFLDRLTGEPRGWVAESLNLQDGPYKDRFYAFMQGDGAHGAGADLSDIEKTEKRARQFAAQVSRDDTMAESISVHIEANPGRKIMHMNGSFHSAALLGTPERLVMRNPDISVANIHPILVDDPDNPSFDAALAGEGQYLLLLYPTPKRFVQMKNINAFLRRTKDQIDEKRCAY